MQCGMTPNGRHPPPTGSRLRIPQFGYGVRGVTRSVAEKLQGSHVHVPLFIFRATVACERCGSPITFCSSFPVQRDAVTLVGPASIRTQVNDPPSGRAHASIAPVAVSTRNKLAPPVVSTEYLPVVVASRGLQSVAIWQPSATNVRANSQSGTLSRPRSNPIATAITPAVSASVASTRTPHSISLRSDTLATSWPTSFNTRAPIPPATTKTPIARLALFTRDNHVHACCHMSAALRGRAYQALPASPQPQRPQHARRANTCRA